MIFILPGINNQSLQTLTVNHDETDENISDYLVKRWSGIPQKRQNVFIDKRSRYNLNHANPTLVQTPHYNYKQSLQIDNDDDPDSDPDYDILPPNCDETDYLMHDDDIMIDDKEELYPIDTDDDEYQLSPPPMSNIFMNHPHYNTNNKIYQIAMNTYCLNTNQNNTFQIPMNVIDIKIKSPENPDNIITVKAGADSQSNVDAIGIDAIVYYKQLGLIKYDNKGIVVGTGNGPIHVHNYVLITVISKEGKQYQRKFWCLESLPTHDFLLSDSLCNKLGWKYREEYDTWEHKPSNIDFTEGELDDLSCSNYPLKNEPEIDITAVKIENEELRPFIQLQLKEYKDVIAKHEWDS